MAEQIVAQIILRSTDGSSIGDAEGPVTAETVDRFRVEEEVIAEARSRLEAFGLSVVSTGPVSLTIEADRELFESVFQTRLRREVAAGEEGAAGQGAGVLMEPVQIPDELSHLVADVVLPRQPQLFP